MESGLEGRIKPEINAGLFTPAVVFACPLLPRRPCSHRLVHCHLAQKFRGRLRQHRIDEHARAEFEAGDPRQPRNHADVPVKVPRPGVFRRPAAHREIQVGIFQPHVNLRQQRPQNPRQIGDLRRR